MTRREKMLKIALPLAALFSAALTPYAVFYQTNWQQILFDQTLQPLAGLTGLFVLVAATAWAINCVTRIGMQPLLLVGATLITAFFQYSALQGPSTSVLETVGVPPGYGMWIGFLALVGLACMVIAVIGRYRVTNVVLSVYFISGLAVPLFELALANPVQASRVIITENQATDFDYDRLSTLHDSGPE